MPHAKTYKAFFLFFFLLLINSFSSAFSQQLVYKFKQFTTNDGLPSSEVHQVLSDSRHFLWFATDHGVCRYDGYKFETFNLPDNSILSMYEDSKKRIWFVSFSGQLFYYEKEKFNAYKYNSIVIKEIEQITINRIYVDSLDNVFVSTLTPECFVINKEGVIKNLYQFNKNWIYQAFEMDKGSYFSYVSASPATIFSRQQIAANYTMVKIEGAAGFQIKVQASLNGRKNEVKKIKKGNFIFFSGQLLLNISNNNKYSIKKFSNDILDTKELEDGTLWVGTLQNGLKIINVNDSIENYFDGLTITSIEKDYEGGVWISTTQAGVFYLNSLQMKHFSKEHSILNQKILCIETPDKSNIWAGGEGGFLFQFQMQKKINQFDFPVVSINGIYSNLLPNVTIVCVGKFINKGVDKLFEYRKGGENFIFLQGGADLVKVNSKIYNGNLNGLVELDLINKRIRFLNKEHFRVMELFFNKERNLLIGNLYGLWKFDDQLHRYDSTKQILNSRITDINENKNGLLLGTRGKGLLILNKNNVFQVTSINGLPSDNIRKIFVDGNMIWLATNKGLSRLSIKSLSPFKYDITNISSQDGLLSNEVNDIKRLDSNIIVATNGGISLFNRDLFSMKKQLPLPLYITGIKVNNIDTTINDNLSFKYKFKNLSLSFVALSYRQSSNVEYRYRLSGIDSNWTNLAGREIQLNPIPYGKYTVQIQARRQGEDWMSGNSLALDISRSLPFWKTIWFQTTIFLIVAFLMLLFFLRRTQKIKQREKEKTFLNKRIAEMELKALRAQMNPHFIFNVLNSIQYYITHNQNDEAQVYMAKFAKLVRSTLDNSRSTFISLADELSLLKLYIDLEKIRFEDRFEYKIDIDNNIDLNSIKIPNMLLQPYVENSIKHGFKNKGVKYFIDISFAKMNENIICVIADNGIGRDRAALIHTIEKDGHTSTGTVIIKEKIEALKLYYNYDLSTITEDIKDENGNPGGTKVILSFPEKADISDIV